MADISDDFNRANSGSLGGNWTIDEGAFSINSNAARNTSLNNYSIAVYSGTAVGDGSESIFVEATFIGTMTSGFQYPGILLSTASGNYDNGYHVTWGSDGTIYLSRRSGGSSSDIATRSWSPTNSLTSIRIEWEESTGQLSVYQNDVLLTGWTGTTTDATHAPTHAGIQMFCGSSLVNLDDFTGGTTASTDVAPDAPTSVVASPGYGEVTITWTDETSGVPTATYTVERKTGAGAYGALASGISQGTEEYVDSTVSNGTAYTYRVRATNSEGDSAWVETSEVTPVDFTLPHYDDFDDLGTGLDFVDSRPGVPWSESSNWLTFVDSGSTYIYTSGGGALTLDVGSQAEQHVVTELKSATLGGPCALYADDNNMVLLEMVFVGAEDAAKLYKRIGGTWTQLDTTGDVMGFVSDTEYEFWIAADGLNLTGYVDGVEVVSGTLAGGDLASLGTEAGLWGESAMNFQSVWIGDADPSAFDGSYVRTASGDAVRIREAGGNYAALYDASGDRWEA